MSEALAAVGFILAVLIVGIIGFVNSSTYQDLKNPDDNSWIEEPQGIVVPCGEKLNFNYELLRVDLINQTHDCLWLIKPLE